MVPSELRSERSATSSLSSSPIPISSVVSIAVSDTLNMNVADPLVVSPVRSLRFLISFRDSVLPTFTFLHVSVSSSKYPTSPIVSGVCVTLYVSP